MANCKYLNLNLRLRTPQLNPTSVASYEVPNFYFFHTANAYDYVDPKTGHTNVHVDIASYKADHYPYNAYAISNVINPLKPYQVGRLVRYELAAVETKDPAVMARGTV